MRSSYESPIETEIEAVYSEIKPMFQKLHAFARKRLRSVVGEEYLPANGLIPEHFLGKS